MMLKNKNKKETTKNSFLKWWFGGFGVNIFNFFFSLNSFNIYKYF